MTGGEGKVVESNERLFCVINVVSVVQNSTILEDVSRLEVAD